MNIDTYQNECVILGCIALFPEVFGDKVPQLSADLFTGEAHRDIFNAVLTAYKTTPQYDEPLITANLSDYDHRAELLECAALAYKTTPFDEHFRLLMKSAQDRYIREQLSTAMMDGTPTPDKLRDIAEIADKAYNPERERKRSEDYHRYLNNLGKPRDVLHTRYRELDRYLNGIRRGTLTIIGARPSVGKTTLALNIAQNIAVYGHKVAFFTLEMTSDMIYEKLVARGCEMDGAALRGNIAPATLTQVENYFNSSGLPENLDVIDDVYTIEAICSYIVSMKPDVAAIDYAQIVGTVKRFDNVRIKIDYISAQLKQTAKRTGCRVILLSQLRRPESGTVKPPTMNDLKESSGLEQDGDYIFMLYRPYAQDKTYIKAEERYKYPPSEAALLIEKNKFGRTGKIKLTFDSAHQDFKEVWKGR